MGFPGHPCQPSSSKPSSAGGWRAEHIAHSLAGAAQDTCFASAAGGSGGRFWNPQQGPDSTGCPLVGQRQQLTWWLSLLWSLGSLSRSSAESFPAAFPPLPAVSDLLMLFKNVLLLPLRHSTWHILLGTPPQACPLFRETSPSTTLLETS